MSACPRSSGESVRLPRKLVIVCHVRLRCWGTPKMGRGLPGGRLRPAGRPLWSRSSASARAGHVGCPRPLARGLGRDSAPTAGPGSSLPAGGETRRGAGAPTARARGPQRLRAGLHRARAPTRCSGRARARSGAIRPYRAMRHAAARAAHQSSPASRQPRKLRRNRLGHGRRRSCISKSCLSWRMCPGPRTLPRARGPWHRPLPAAPKQQRWRQAR